MDSLTKSTHFLPMGTTTQMDNLVNLYITEIVFLYGELISIVSDRYSQFIFRFWGSLHEVLDMKLNFSTTYYSQTNGQIKHTNETLEYMFRAHVFDFKMNQDESLPFCEFAYNNNYYFIIGMAPYEALCGQKCRTPVCQEEVDV